MSLILVDTTTKPVLEMQNFLSCMLSTLVILRMKDGDSFLPFILVLHCSIFISVIYSLPALKHEMNDSGPHWTWCG